MTAHAHTRPRPAPHPPATARTPARSALAAAIDARDAAQADLQTANARSQRARILMEKAQRDLAQLGDVEAAIRNHQAAAYVAASQAEAGDGAAPVIDVPPALAERRERSRQAATTAAAAEGAFALIKSECEAAVLAHRAAEAVVAAAAKQVLAAEGDRLCADLAAALAVVHGLDDQLRALAMFSAQRPGETWAQGHVGLSRAVVDRLRTPLGHRPQLAGLDTYEARALPAWRLLFAALQRDADAQLS